jgi:hypothetical protein
VKLRGPADPNAFRRKDQWGRRVYFDNLPSCNVADAWDGEVFAFTTFKGAWDKQFKKKLPSGELVALDALRAARFILDNPATMNMKRAQAEATIAKAADHDLKEAGDRGTDVHRILEALAAGQDPGLLFPPLRADALEYRPACEQFLAEHRPEFVYTEVVGINRTLGYGGTVDVYANMDAAGGLVSLDWKSRGDDSQHGAYDNEAAQVGGAYTHFDYLIVEIDGQAQRVPMPALAGAVIVSLKTDSYVAYPVDMNKAWEAFQAMHQGYMLKLDGQRAGRSAVGRQLRPPTQIAPPADTAPVPPVELNADLYVRINALTDEQRAELKARWPKGVKLKQTLTLNQRFEVAALISAIEAPATVSTPPDEGRAVEQSTIDLLRQKTAALPPNGGAAWLTRTIHGCEVAGASISMRDVKSLRRFELCRALYLLAANDQTERLDDMVRAVVGDVPGDTVALLASMGADEATQFALHVTALTAGVEVVAPRLSPVA